MVTVDEGWTRLQPERKSMKPVCLFVILAIALGVSSTRLTTTGQASHSSARTAAELYVRHCASCHGKDGQAKTAKGKLNQARDLTDPEWQDRTSDERLFNSIMNGKRKMPGFSKKLSEQEIDALVIYVRGLKRT